MKYIIFSRVSCCKVCGIIMGRRTRKGDIWPWTDADADADADADTGTDMWWFASTGAAMEQSK
jgi:hypothetical protein